MLKYYISILFFLVNLSQMAALEITYTVSFPQPHDHYAKVQLQLKNVNLDKVVLKMPVWTPGSYLVREFSRQVERETAVDSSGNRLKFEKTAKNSWILDTKNQKSVIFEYWVYCYEQSVRTSFVDESHALLNGANIFMFIEDFENQPYIVQIEKPKNWNTISTALPVHKNKVNIRIAENYDQLVDSPIEIGNHEVWKFEAKDIPHQVATYGPGNFDKEKVLTDLKKIVETATDIMGGNPCKEYLFINHHTDNKFGGLEHLHSTVCHIPRWDYEPKDKYQSTMGLLAHEYFHLWNGKRIRPKELGPFDYLNENYTHLLWVVEGITSYYDDYILYKSGIFTREEYLSTIAKVFTKTVNQPGDDVQSLTESSFDAWIKYYRQHENSQNNQVTYYGKGACIAIALNLMILESTKGEKSLDDVMRKLYQVYLQNPNEGYTKEDILQVLKEISGIDFSKFYTQYIEGTTPVNYAELFQNAGIELKDKNADTNTTKKELGWTLTWKEGKLIISGLDKNYGAYQSGLNVNDEIISIDGFRVFDGFEKIVESKKPGDKIEVLISRQGIIQTIPVTITSNKKVDYTLTPVAKPEKSQKKLFTAWLGE